MKTVRDPEALREALAPYAGRVVGLVPTMGALHEGHRSLLRRARAECDVVVVSLFVNPTQFGPSEDFARYPRDEARDAAAVGEERAELLYAPTAAAMYPPGFGTRVVVDGISTVFEGAHRPGHFEGVATVVAKLLLQAAPTRAYFGEKDWQQLVVIRRMVADLNLPVVVVACPTVRDPDGLALSSRNTFLSVAERETALRLVRSLRAVESLVAEGVTRVADLREGALAALADPAITLDYLAFVGQDDLAEVEEIKGPTRVLVAARVGRTRLIDNIRVMPPACGR